jgi:hypothetical protein
MSPIGNAVKYAVFAYALNLDKTTQLTLTNAAVYGFGSGMIKNYCGNGIICTSARVIGGIYLTSLVDPEHPITLKNIIHIKIAEGCCLVAGLAFLLGVIGIAKGIEVALAKMDKFSKSHSE